MALTDAGRFHSKKDLNRKKISRAELKSSKNSIHALRSILEFLLEEDCCCKPFELASLTEIGSFAV